MQGSPQRRPGPASRTSGDGGGPASVSSRSGSVSVLFKCTYCGRIFRAKKDLAQHKKDEHADQLTHITESSVATSGVAQPFRRRAILPVGRQGGGQEVRPGAPEPPSDTDSDPNESRENMPPPPKPATPKRGRGRKQGRNKSPLQHGKKKKVVGPDGVEREELVRTPQHPGG